MCLDIRLGDKVLMRDTVVYKVVRYYKQGAMSFFEPCFFGRYRHFKKGVNYASVQPIEYYTSKGLRTYPSGYHCFTRREAAKIYMEEFFQEEGATILEFVIPKGTKVSTGYTEVFDIVELRKLYTLVSPVIVWNREERYGI